MSAAAMQARAIEAPGPAGLLKGTLLIPAPAADGKAPPVLLIIPGPGAAIAGFVTRFVTGAADPLK